MAVYMPPKGIPAQKISAPAPTTRKDMSTGKGGQPAGLDKFMVEPAGSFGFGHGGGAPAVPTGDGAPQNEIVGETNMSPGQGMVPTTPANVYMPNKKSVYGVA